MILEVSAESDNCYREKLQNLGFYIIADGTASGDGGLSISVSQPNDIATLVNGLGFPVEILPQQDNARHGMAMVMIIKDGES